MPPVSRVPAASNSRGEYYVFDWTADGSGNATGDIPPGAGYVEALEHDINGVSDPLAAFNITVTTQFGTDVMGGNGASISVAANSIRKPRCNNQVDGIGSLQPVFYAGPLTINISGAGASKTGRTILYVLRV